MSGVNYWLQKQRKTELTGLADYVGMKDYDALLKTDLEIALDEHLRKNQSKLSGDPKLEGFYKRLGSPVKRDSNIGAGAVTSGDEKEKPKARPRKSITKPKESEDGPSESEAPTGASSLLPRTPRTPSLSFARNLDLPTTPSQLANSISAQQSSLRASISRSYNSSFIPRTLNYARAQASSVIAISLAVLAIEAYGLIPTVMPSRYLTTIPPVPALHTAAHAIYVPDLFAIFTLAFWGPVSLWLITSIGLPAAGAWFFNLTKGESVVDPMVFHVFKGLTAYVVYSKGGVGGESVEVIKKSVPAGVAGLLIGAGVGGIASLWDTTVSK